MVFLTIYLTITLSCDTHVGPAEPRMMEIAGNMTTPGSWGSMYNTVHAYRKTPPTLGPHAPELPRKLQRVTLYPSHIYVQHPQHCCHIMTTDLLESASLSTPQTVVEDISPLEQDLLDEYERLADNMKKVILRGAAQHIPRLHNCLSLLREIFPSGG